MITYLLYDLRISLLWWHITRRWSPRCTRGLSWIAVSHWTRWPRWMMARILRRWWPVMGRRLAWNSIWNRPLHPSWTRRTSTMHCMAWRMSTLMWAVTGRYWLMASSRWILAAECGRHCLTGSEFVLKITPMYFRTLDDTWHRPPRRVLSVTFLSTGFIKSRKTADNS